MPVPLNPGRHAATFLRNQSLRTRAFVALGVAFALLAAMLAWLLAADIRSRMESAKARLLSEVRLIASREDIILARADAILNGLPLRVEVQPGVQPLLCEAFLTARVRGEPSFRAAAVLEPDGRVRCASNPAPAEIRDAGSGFFRNALDTREIAFAPAGVSGDSAAILLGKAIRDSGGTVTGIGLLELSQDWLHGEIAAIAVPDDGRITVLDATSFILARHPDPEGLAGQRRPDSKIAQQVLANPGEGTLEETTLSGELRLIAYTPIFESATGSSIHLLMSVPKLSVIGPARVRGIESFVMLGLVLVGVMATLVIGTDRMLLRPLNRLVQTSLRLERGDLSARSGLEHSNTETGQLAQRLDHLASAIQARESELIEKATLLDNANDAITVRDADNRITYWNRAAEALYGWTAAEAIGQTHEKLLRVDDAAFAQGEAALRTLGQWKGELAICNRAGGPLTVLASWTRLDDAKGVPLSVLMIDADITSRKVAEGRLMESEERFRSITETISEIFWIKDAAQTSFLYVSPAFQTLTGRSSAALYESSFVWPNMIHPDDRDRVVEAARHGQAAGNFDETYRILHTDGTVRWLRERAFPVRAPDGALVRVVGSATDITVSRKVEEQLQQSQKMEAIGRLAGGVAHDFNNLLTVILGYTELLLSRRDLDDGIVAAIGPIGDAAERASALTSQLLGFSRQTILKPQVHDLNVTVGDLADMLTRLIGEDIDFNTVLEPDLDQVLVDPGQMGQILMNLIVNARDAMPDGGKLTVETVNLVIGEDLAAPDRRAGPYVMLAVTDTGTGMAKDVRDRIFEPFFTTKSMGKGTGLGLSMVFGIVQQSGGFIGVYSEPGLGTTFKIFFPSVQTDEAQIVPAPRGDLALGTETILLVEDEPGVRDLSRVSLESHGYTVVTATDGRDALDSLARSQMKIDLVLTDVVMPNVSGPVLIGQLKAQFPGIRVLFMSGYTDDVVVRHGLLDADVAFIQKPFTPTELARRARSVLDGRG